MPKRRKWALAALAALVAAVLLVCGGFLLGMDPSVGGAARQLLPADFFAEGAANDGEDFALQQEVLSRLESTYYKAIDVKSLEAHAIDGMLAGLGDPYTVYMDPDEYASFLEDSSGSYSGVGMVVEMKDSLVTIVSVFKGSPAEAAGIQSGDIILAVDGLSTAGLNLEEVVGKIKGPEDTKVTLQMYRPPLSGITAGAEESESAGDETATVDLSRLPQGGTVSEYTLVRKTIAVPVTEAETMDVAGKEVADIRFFTFSVGSAAQLRAQVKEAVEQDHVAAIILDLRSNGGGLLDEAVKVASIFIAQGEIVSTEGLHSPEQTYYAEGDAFAEVPLYVLVDKYTASASEIVSGALQDHKRAVLVGETTFGKGLVQVIEPLSNGGALKVTSAVYLTPNGRNINETGIAPDVQAPDDPNTPDVDEGVQAVLGLISRDVGRQ